MAETLLSRFLRYVQVDTQSDVNSKNCPSSPGQWDLQRILQKEMQEIGAQDVELSEFGYLFATLPATSRKKSLPTIAFLAHVDTAPDFAGKGVKPIVHRKYDGQPIRFPDNPRLLLDAGVAPELLQAKGNEQQASGD